MQRLDAKEGRRKMKNALALHSEFAFMLRFDIFLFHPFHVAAFLFNSSGGSKEN